MFINYVYAKIYKGNKTKDKQCMEKINFIFTKNGFHIDEIRVINKYLVVICTL